MPRVGDVVRIAGRRFTLENGIGSLDGGAQGGFSVVFAAHEINRKGKLVGPPLAIKMVNLAKMKEHQKTRTNGQESARKWFVESLEKDIQILKILKKRYGNLRHVNIVDIVHDGKMEFIEELGNYYPALVMEQCQMPLAHILGAGNTNGPAGDARRRLMTLPGILGLLIDISTALQALANCESADVMLVHRDLKPHNILERDGTFLLADFGNGKRSDGSTLSVGGISKNYLAPELWDAVRRLDRGGVPAAPVSLRAVDIYSLGMTMVDVLIGEIPWQQSERQLPAPGSADILGDLRGKIRAAITALPAFGVEQGATLVPFAADVAEQAEIRRHLERLVYSMVQLQADLRPDAAKVLSQLTQLQNHLRTSTARSHRPSPPAIDIRIMTGSVAAASNAIIRRRRYPLHGALMLLSAAAVAPLPYIITPTAHMAELWQNVTTPSVRMFRNCEDCPMMMLIPGGTVISRSFAMSVVPIMPDQHRQYAAFMGNPVPAGQISAWTADAIADWMSARTGHRFQLASTSHWHHLSRLGQSPIDATVRLPAGLATALRRYEACASPVPCPPPDDDGGTGYWLVEELEDISR